MIASLFSAIFNFIIGFINILLSPIDAFISLYLPNLATFLGYTNNMINLGISSIGYVISLSMLNPDLVAVLYLYVTFIIMVPVVTHSIKLVIHWYNVLKP